MKALVFGGLGEKVWDFVVDLGIQQLIDVIVKVDMMTICGIDLHIFKGDVPVVIEGCIFGYEVVGMVVEIGVAIFLFVEGDCVLVFVIMLCGRW